MTYHEQPLYEHLEACDTRQDIMRQMLEEVTSAKDDFASHVVTLENRLMPGIY
jgi:hypothetical protein